MSPRDAPNAQQMPVTVSPATLPHHPQFAAFPFDRALREVRDQDVFILFSMVFNRKKEGKERATDVAG